MSAKKFHITTFLMKSCRSGAGVRWLAAATLFASLVPGGTDWGDCANISACACKWSGGKKTASCPSAGLTSLPPLSSEIQVLDLHDNVLAELKEDAFSNAGLLNLQRVNLRASHVRTLHADAFRELSILVELDLAFNDIHALSPGTFRSNERLRLLVLSGNPLSQLNKDQFPPLPHLRTLDLSGCRLRRVHTSALPPNNLPQLDELDLSRNLLSTLREPAVAGLPALKTLRLSGNPWRCNCNLRAFRNWFISSNLGTEPVYCAEPSSNEGISFHDLDKSVMTCAPQVIVSTRVIRAEPGTDVSFGCVARGDPRPVVTWSFDGQNIDNETAEEISLKEMVIHPNEQELDEGLFTGWWLNVSISNVTRGAAGEWTCTGNNTAGTARAGLSLVLPRARTATARSPPQREPHIGVLAAALGSLVTLGVLSTCACWHARRRSAPARRLTDQEKKLLDSSLGSGADRSSADLASFELPERPLQLSISPQSQGGSIDHVHTPIGGSDVTFPSPPAEFALPAPYGNIFISVSVSGQRNREFPDLIGSGDGSTLLRRSRQCCVPSYDNMGPRVTAAGSSMFLLQGSDSVYVPSLPHPSLVVTSPPQPDFVAL